MYAQKLRTRTGGGATMLSDGTVIAAAGNIAAGGSRPLRRDERPDDPSMSWHLQPGVRDLLTYCDMRGIVRALLPWDVDSDEAAAAQGEQLIKSLKIPPFAHVLTLSEIEATRRGEPSAVVRAISTLDLPKTSNLMLVSDQSAALRAAKAARSFTCFYLKRLPGAPKSLPADFHATDMNGLQDAIEAVNGVTFRNSDTEIRTKFGVHQT